jgi:hypothetical protein
MKKIPLHNLINLIVPLSPLLNALQAGNMSGTNQIDFLRQMRARLLDAIDEIDHLLKENDE